MNRVELIGRITRDPELRYTNNNIATTRFTLAVNRPFQGQNGEQGTDFINIVVWRKQAENVKKYVSKGSLIAVFEHGVCLIPVNERAVAGRG